MLLSCSECALHFEWLCFDMANIESQHRRPQCNSKMRRDAISNCWNKSTRHTEMERIERASLQTLVDVMWNYIYIGTYLVICYGFLFDFCFWTHTNIFECINRYLNNQKLIAFEYISAHMWHAETCWNLLEDVIQKHTAHGLPRYIFKCYHPRLAYIKLQV